MTKKSTRERAKAKQAKRQQQHTLIMAVAIAVLVGSAALFLIDPFDPPEIAQERLDLDPVYGPADAELTIVEYASYGCRACRALHNSGVIEDIVEEYDGRVNFVFRDFPYISPPYDPMASAVAQCVLDQSNDAFWEFHHLLFTDYYMNSTQEELVTVGRELLDIDGNVFAACVVADTHAQTVAYDGERGRALGLRGSPTLFIGEQRIFSNAEADIRAAVEDALNG